MRENGTASDRPLDNVILTRMRGFAGMNKLKKEALKVIAAGMSPEEIAGLHALFQARRARAWARVLLHGACRPRGSPACTPCSRRGALGPGLGFYYTGHVARGDRRPARPVPGAARSGLGQGSISMGVLVMNRFSTLTASGHYEREGWHQPEDLRVGHSPIFCGNKKRGHSQV